MTLHVGLIGLGYWGTRLLRTFAALPGVEVRHVVDADRRTHAQVPSAMTVGVDPAELWADAAVDAVLVATPPATHFELARAALRAGRHCWVEKPLALSLAEAEELVALAERVERKLFVDETFLYDPLVQTARDWLATGRIGALQHLSFERLGLGRIRRDSDVWWNSAPHDLSILRYLVRDEVTEVQVHHFAHTQEKLSDHCVAALRLAGGASVHIYLSWLSPEKRASVAAVGSAGMLRYEGRFAQRELALFTCAVEDPVAAIGNVVSVRDFAEVERLRGGPEEPLALAAHAFVDLVVHGAEAPSEARHSLRSIAVLERGQRGGRKLTSPGQWLSVRPSAPTTRA